MKKYPLHSKNQQGNTLLLTIVVTGLIGFLLAAYLTLVTSQNGANVRSQSWNSAMPVVEAGIEEALQHLNKNGATNGSLSTDGWSGGGSTFTITRPIGDAYYSVTISGYYPGTLTNTPIIESKGYVVMPLVLASAQGALLATAGGGNGTINFLGRGVRVRTKQDFIFAKGMVAKENIDLNGNDIRTDSFDSMDPLYSTNGVYNPAWIKDNGDVAVNSSLTNSLNAGNANIYGHVSVGPDGTIAVGTQGAVGSLIWQQAGNKGVQSGWSANDMNVSFPDVEPPFNGGAFTPAGGWITNVTSTVSTSTNASTSYGYPSTCGGTVSSNTLTTAAYPVSHPGPVTTNRNGAGTITGYTYNRYTCSDAVSATNVTYTATYYDYILDTGNYQLADLNGSVYVKGVATLYVTDTLDMTALVIKSGNSLQVYSSAPTVKLAGNTTANSDGTADSFGFWGMPSVKEITFSGNASFTGTIYAPDANFTLNGSGANTIDFIGASITKTARMNGHFNFHYDEALRRFGPFRGYIVSAWNEMAPSDVPRFYPGGLAQ
jgi:hypothetical protein